MISIFHGDNQKASREAILAQIDNQGDLLHLDQKNADPDQINNFLFGPSLFPGTKTLWIDNFFSIPKAKLTKILPLIIQSDSQIYLWQDKSLTQQQIKSVPQAKTILFRLDNSIFKCLYSIKPGGLKSCLPQYQKVISSGNYDLFLYLLKSHLRKRLTPKLIPIYLETIMLDFQNKSGQLTTPREIALERIIIKLCS